jgi:spermidine/putrescine transport system substrate-binding protein
LHALLLLSLMTAAAACQGSQSPTPTAQATEGKTLTLYNWVDYMPQAVLDAFAAEYGIEVVPVVYESQDEAIANLDAGKQYDLIVLTVEYLPHLITDNHLAQLDRRNVPNLKNIPANFRDPSFDVGNRYAIPFHWGTTGLLVRSDLVEKLPTRWADLWDPQYGGKVAIWPLIDALLPIALKTLGYSANTEDPQEVQAAFDLLEEIKSKAYIIGNENASVIPDLAEGKAVLAYGWAYDALLAAEQNLPIDYVLPEEGAVLWADYLVVPATSPNKAEAELFLNFLLRPDIGAMLVEESYYPVANDAALPLIDPELRSNRIVYPSDADLRNAELTLPLSDEGRQLRLDGWNRFMADLQ